LEISKNIRDYVIKVLTDLISIPTINPPGKDYETCANYLSDELKSMGFKVQNIKIPETYLDEHYPYAPQHKGYPRYIVYGKIGNGNPILHFNGHYDVVPPGTGWTKNPFKPVIENGRIYGRGSTDMKGGIASIMATLKYITETSEKINGTLEVAFVPDEESGGIGSKYLLENGYSKPDYVIIGEPTTLKRIIIGHKGFIRGIVHIFGKQAHGSSPWLGENAFLKASAVALKFMELYEPILKNRKTNAPVALLEGAHPTINLGGHAESTANKDNIVPGEFIFSFDRRVLPEENLENVISEIKDYFNKAAELVNAKHEIKILNYVPAALTPINSQIVNIAKECIGTLLSLEPRIEISLGRNDAVYYINIAHSQVINLGPGIEKTAHTADEYTEIDELIKIIILYKCIIEKILKSRN
jgi:succinyl-diaminopimelate desuccinylase